jgi:hypothetical protein
MKFKKYLTFFIQKAERYKIIIYNIYELSRFSTKIYDNKTKIEENGDNGCDLEFERLVVVWAGHEGHLGSGASHVGAPDRQQNIISSSCGWVRNILE